MRLSARIARPSTMTGRASFRAAAPSRANSGGRTITRQHRPDRRARRSGSDAVHADRSSTRPWSAPSRNTAARSSASAVSGEPARRPFRSLHLPAGEAPREREKAPSCHPPEHCTPARRRSGRHRIPEANCPAGAVTKRECAAPPPSGAAPPRACTRPGRGSVPLPRPSSREWPCGPGERARLPRCLATRGRLSPVGLHVTRRRTPSTG